MDSFQSHSKNDMDSSHELCVQLVDQLSQEGCIYLLQNWLLSLAMCDVSFFVTFQCLSYDQSTTEEWQSIESGGVMHYDDVEEDVVTAPAAIAEANSSFFFFSKFCSSPHSFFFSSNFFFFRG